MSNWAKTQTKPYLRSRLYFCNLSWPPSPPGRSSAPPLHPPEAPLPGSPSASSLRLPPLRFASHLKNGYPLASSGDLCQLSIIYRLIDSSRVSYCDNLVSEIRFALGHPWKWDVLAWFRCCRTTPPLPLRCLLRCFPLLLVPTLGLLKVNSSFSSMHSPFEILMVSVLTLNIIVVSYYSSFQAWCLWYSMRASVSQLGLLTSSW